VNVSILNVSVTSTSCWLCGVSLQMLAVCRHAVRTRRRQTSHSVASSANCIVSTVAMLESRDVRVGRSHSHVTECCHVSVIVLTASLTLQMSSASLVLKHKQPLAVCKLLYCGYKIIWSLLSDLTSSFLQVESMQICTDGAFTNSAGCECRQSSGSIAWLTGALKADCNHCTVLTMSHSTGWNTQQL